MSFLYKVSCEWQERRRCVMSVLRDKKSNLLFGSLAPRATQALWTHGEDL